MSDLQSQAQDLRHTIPDWSRYAILVDPKSNKFYEVRVDLLDSGMWQMTIRFGRRPDLGAGTIKPSVHPSMSIAIALAEEQIRAKIRKGYWHIPRPDEANLKVRREYGEN